MSISIKNIVKQSAKFNVVSVISFLVQIPNQLIIGIFLEPKEYGVISFVALWRLYAGLVKPGIMSAAQREIPYLIGKKEEQKSVKVQNISISAALLYSIVPFSAILCASFFYSNKVVRIGLILTAATFFVDRFANCWSSVNFIKQNFTVVATGKLIGVIVLPVTIMSSIYWLGVYAVLIAPLVCVLFTCGYYFKKAPIGYYFQFEWVEVVRLAKIGFVLSLSGIIFYGYRMTDRTIIASFLSLHDLGLFAFAMGFIMFGLNFLADFGRVLEPILWEHSGKTKNPQHSFGDTKRMAVYMALLTAIIIPLVQVGYNAAVKLVVSRYIESISLFFILSSLLYLTSMTTIPNIILRSVVINKQALTTGVYAVGVGINIVLDLLMIHMGYGIEAIALVTVVSQGIVTFVLYFLARSYIFSLHTEAVRFIAAITIPFSISILFSIFHVFLNSRTIGPGMLMLVSIFCQAIIWSFVLAVFYREYFPKDKIIGLAKGFYETAIAGIRRK